MARFRPKPEYYSQAKAMMNGVRWKKAFYWSVGLNIVLLIWSVCARY